MKTIVSLLLISCLCLACLCGCRNTQMEAQLDEGIAYLESLEQRKPEDIADRLHEIEQKKLEAQKEAEQKALEEEREAKIEKLLSGEDNVWEQFRSYVILGDSRAVGFYYFDFLEKSRVLAGGGETIADIPDRMDQILALNPEYIFLCYGLNDVSIGYWDNKEEYVEAFGEALDSLSEALPNAKIVVSSILPARDPAFERASIWRQIPDYSAAVGEYCQAHGIAFANNDQICDEYDEYWQDDGIHVKPEFYPYWAANLIVASWEDTGNE